MTDMFYYRFLLIFIKQIKTFKSKIDGRYYMLFKYI